MITRGGGDHAASLRNEFDDVKTEVKNMKEDIKGILPMFEKTMKVMEENLHLAKEEICGAKARMEMTAGSQPWQRRRRSPRPW